jgi:hypothetical protein
MFRSNFFFFTSTIVGDECSNSRPTRFNIEEILPSTHWARSWVDPSAGLEEVEKRTFFTLPELEHRSLGGPFRCQSLYRLRFPGSSYQMVTVLSAFNKQVILGL